MFPLVPWAADIITLTAQACQTKFISAVGPAIIGELGLGIATAVEMYEDGGYNGCDKAGAVLNCCSPLAKFGSYASKFGDEVAIVAGVVSFHFPDR